MTDIIMEIKSKSYSEHARKIYASEYETLLSKLSVVDGQNIEITNLEWVAIRVGAVPQHELCQILKHVNLDRIKELATPRGFLS